MVLSSSPAVCRPGRDGGTKGQAMGSWGHREVTPFSQRARPQAGVQVSSGPATPTHDDGTVDGNCPALAVRTDEQLALSSSLLRPPAPL